MLFLGVSLSSSSFSSSPIVGGWEGCGKCCDTCVDVLCVVGHRSCGESLLLESVVEHYVVVERLLILVVAAQKNKV